VPTPFTRTVRSLRRDSAARSLLAIATAAVLLGAWVAWLLLARVELYEVSQSARLETESSVHHIETPVGGRVLAVRLTLGRRVRAGELLVSLDDSEQRLALDAAVRRLGALRRQLEPLDHELGFAQQEAAGLRSASRSALDVAVAERRVASTQAHFAAQEAERFEQLRVAGSASEAGRQKAASEARAQRSAAAAARHEIARLRSESGALEAARLRDVEEIRLEIERVRAEIGTAEATAARLQHEVEERRIVSPVNGRLGEVAELRIGSVVAGGDPIASVVPEGGVRAIAEFTPEAAFGRLRPGQRARMRLHGFPWTRYGTLRARVARVASEVREGHVRVELDIARDRRSPIPLEHGLPGDVEVAVERVAPADLVLAGAGRWLRRTPSRGEPP